MDHNHFNRYHTMSLLMASRHESSTPTRRRKHSPTPTFSDGSRNAFTRSQAPSSSMPLPESTDSGQKVSDGVLAAAQSQTISGSDSCGFMWYIYSRDGLLSKKHAAAAASSVRRMRRKRRGISSRSMIMMKMSSCMGRQSGAWYQVQQQRG